MKKLIILTLFFYQAIICSGQWYQQTSNTDIRLSSLFFINEDIGWIFGLDTLNHGTLFKTNSGGSDWDSIWSSSSYYGINILFSDSMHGWLNGSQDYLRTEDGGFSWIANPDSLWAFDFVNDSDGFALMGNYGGSNLLYKTSNIGITWTWLDTLPKYCYGDMDFVDENTGYYKYLWGSGGAGSGQALMKTADGGISWENRLLPDGSPDLAYTMLHFMSENIGFTSILYGNKRGLYKTLDGAESWEKIYDKYTCKKFFLTEDNGYIVTRNNASDSCFIEHTCDGGQTWITQYSSTDIIEDIFFTDSLNGWAVGWNGLILHTSNGGGITTSTFKSKPVNDQLKIYPNPVQNNAIIEFRLKEKEFVIIDIYNSKGELSGQPIRQIFSKGKHELEINMSHLAAGIYYCRLSSASNYNTLKIIKSR